MESVKDHGIVLATASGTLMGVGDLVTEANRTKAQALKMLAVSLAGKGN